MPPTDSGKGVRDGKPFWVVNKDFAERVSETCRPFVERSLSSLAILTRVITGYTQVSEWILLDTPDAGWTYVLPVGLTLEIDFRATLPLVLQDALRQQFPGLSSSKDLARVMRLYSASLLEWNDRLQAFSMAWIAIEVFVNKTFRFYEDHGLPFHGESIPSSVSSYLERLKAVLKDRYRLVDKFTIVALALGIADLDDQVSLFKKAKDLRDDLLHGEEIDESALPTTEIRELLSKLFVSHIGRTEG